MSHLRKSEMVTKHSVSFDDFYSLNIQSDIDVFTFLHYLDIFIVLNQINATRQKHNFFYEFSENLTLFL
jgi:hypothetical protein